jgi:hypothetical protein
LGDHFGMSVGPGQASATVNATKFLNVVGWVLAGDLVTLAIITRQDGSAIVQQNRNLPHHTWRWEETVGEILAEFPKSLIVPCCHGWMMSAINTLNGTYGRPPRIHSFPTFRTNQTFEPVASCRLGHYDESGRRDDGDGCGPQTSESSRRLGPSGETRRSSSREVGRCGYVVYSWVSC